MTEPESFLSRWSRMKRSSVAEAAEQAAAATVPAVAAEATVDLASLPSLESIGPGSDIQAFLQAGVPLELVRAALRSAWVTDPAIRGFIEVADNQWDFNEHDAIPGFGTLGPADAARALVTRAMTALDSLAPTVPQGAALADTPRVATALDSKAAPVDTCAVVTQLDHAVPAVGQAPAAILRSHGTALPK